MNAPQSGCLADFPALDWVHRTRGHATLYQALAKRAGCSTTTLVSRGQHFVCLTPTQVDRTLAGEVADNLTDLFLTQCGCANKCSVLVNHQAAQNTLNALERSNWGAHLIEGLILYGRFSRSKQGWVVFFFSSSLAVNALWHGPDNDISGEKGSTKRNWPVLEKMANHHTNQKQNEPRRPANPPARLAFRLQSNKAARRTGPGPTKNTHN